MKNKVLLIFIASFAFCVTAVFANGRAEPVNAELVNEGKFDLDGITTISISYDSGRVLFLEGSDNTLSFKEYLSSDNEKHYASSSASGALITIESGKRPWFGLSRARLEVYIPRSFEGDYRVSMASGNLEANTGIAATGRADFSVQSGTMRLEKVSAGSIRLRAASGSIHILGLYGNTDAQLSSGSLYVSEMQGCEHRVRLSSGSAEIAGVSGGGSFSSLSGRITMEVTRLSADLDFNLSSGSLDLTLPRNAAFHLDAETSSGSINVNSGNDSYAVKSRSSVMRPIGDNPEFTIRAEISSGSITIKR